MTDNNPKNTAYVLIRESGSEHHTMTRRENLTDDCVFEKTIETTAGYIDQYVREG